MEKNSKMRIIKDDDIKLGNLAGRKPRFPIESGENKFRKEYFLAYILLPFYIIWKFLYRNFYWLFDFLFFDRVSRSRRGIGFGPAFDSYYSRKFSWGKLSFICLVLFVVFFLIFRCSYKF